MPDGSDTPQPRRKLTKRQAKWVRKTVTAPSAAEAAREAGYSALAAKQIAYENMTKPYLADQVIKLRQRQMERLDVTTESILNNIAHIAEDATIKGEHAPAIKAYELLGKHLGLFVERKVNVNIDASGAHLAALLALAQRRAEPIDITIDGIATGPDSDLS